MAQLSKFLRSVEGNGLAFYCSGCKNHHHINYGEGSGPRWHWNGDVEKPTFSPSVLVRGIRALNEAELESYEEAYEKCGHTSAILDDARFASVCHTFITDGRIQYLDDCTHELAGQTIDLPELPHQELI